MWIKYFREPEQHLMLGESGVYALLVYHYVPRNRLLRELLTNEVVPTLRDAQDSGDSNGPMLSLLDWPEMSLSLLHWQDERWIRFRDMPYLLKDQTQRRTAVVKPWRRRFMQVFQSLRHSMG